MVGFLTAVFGRRHVQEPRELALRAVTALIVAQQHRASALCPVPLLARYRASRRPFLR